jgi:chromosome segregation ATPase
VPVFDVEVDYCRIEIERLSKRLDGMTQTLDQLKTRLARVAQVNEHTEASVETLKTTVQSSSMTAWAAYDKAEDAITKVGLLRKEVIQSFDEIQQKRDNLLKLTDDLRNMRTT